MKGRRGIAGTARRVACVVGAGLIAAAGPGCGSDSEGARFIGPTVGTPRVMTVTADWDDVDAAVEVGAGKAEMAVTLEEATSQDEVVFYLRTIRDEPARLTVRRTSGGPTPTIELEARAGIFGQPGDEERLLKAVAQRLEELKGKEWAPVK